MYLFFIISNLLSCIALGILIAIVIVGLVYVITALLNGRQTIGSVLTMAICFVASLIAGIRLVGAYYAKSFVSSCVDVCTTILNNLGKSADEILASDLLKLVSDKFPKISVLFDFFSFTKGLTAQYMIDYVTEDVNDHLLWCWIWLIGIFIFFAILTALCCDRKNRDYLVSTRHRSSRPYSGNLRSNRERVYIGRHRQFNN